MQSLPLVSIVVPSWQQGQFLRHCLLSLKHQTYPHVEVIVRDNLSNDDTSRVLAEFGPAFARVVRERDAGQADALLKGFAEARGDVFGWLNADDMLMPQAVELAVRALQAGSDVVYGHCAFLTEDGQFLRYFDDIDVYDPIELRSWSDFIPQPSTFFRRTAYERAGGLDPSLVYAMDWDLWCRMSRSGARFAFVDEVFSGARLWPGQKTARGGWRRLLELTRVNHRHATTRLPMLPLLYLAHLHSTWLKQWIGPFHDPMRAAWRALTGRRRHEKQTVFGLRPPRQVVAGQFRVRYPLFAHLDTARLRLGAAADGGVVHARLRAGGHDCGASGAASGEWIGWNVPSAAFTPFVDIEGQVHDGGTLPLRLDVEHGTQPDHAALGA